MSGGTWGGSLNWVGHNKGVLAARSARRLAQRQILEVTTAELKERGIMPEAKPMSQAQTFWIGFAVGLLLGLLIGGIFWELT